MSSCSSPSGQLANLKFELQSANCLRHWPLSDQILDPPCASSVHLQTRSSGQYSPELYTVTHISPNILQANIWGFLFVEHRLIRTGLSAPDSLQNSFLGQWDEKSCSLGGCGILFVLVLSIWRVTLGICKSDPETENGQKKPVRFWISGFFNSVHQERIGVWKWWSSWDVIRHNRLCQQQVAFLDSSKNVNLWPGFETICLIIYW